MKQLEINKKLSDLSKSNGYFLLAKNLNKLLKILSSTNPQTVKNISAFCTLLGLCLIYFTFKYYDN